MKTFQFAPGLDLRVIDRDGEPWFVAKDVCEALEFDTSKTGTGKYLAGLAEDEVNTVRETSVIRRGNPNFRIISESGLYALIMRSNKPQARVFRKWVTSEVLPTIRKTGGYMVPSLAVQAVEDPAVFMARALLVAQEVITGLKKQTKGLEAADQSGPGVLLKAWLQPQQGSHETRSGCGKG